jgi:hypothetical protein
VRTRFRLNHVALAGYAWFIALSAYFGAIGLISGLLPIGAPLTARLPFHSPVFGGIALALVVGLPASVVTVLSWRRHPRTLDASALAGLLLVGWIAVELIIAREFSVLQVVYAAAGAGLIALGNVAVLRQLADVVIALPSFVTAPLRRHRHQRREPPPRGTRANGEDLDQQSLEGTSSDSASILSVREQSGSGRPSGI